MPVPGLHPAHRAIDCECGTTLEAGDDAELAEELYEHIAAAHETGLRRNPAELLTDAYEA
jgi:predicted small metal-binding protein